MEPEDKIPDHIPDDIKPDPKPTVVYRITTMPAPVFGPQAAAVCKAADGHPIIDLRPLQGQGNPDFQERDGRDPVCLKYYEENSPPNLVESIKGMVLMMGGCAITCGKGLRRSVSIACLVADALKKDGHAVEVRHLSLGDKPFNAVESEPHEADDKADTAHKHGKATDEGEEQIEHKAKTWGDLGISDPEEKH